MNEPLVYIPNRLIEARYCMNLRAMRLRLLALQKLHPLNYLLGEAAPVTVTAGEWETAFTDPQQSYRDLAIAAAEFAAARVSFKGDPKTYSFADKAEYVKGQGKIIIHFNADFLRACYRPD